MFRAAVMNAAIRILSTDLVAKRNVPIELVTLREHGIKRETTMCIIRIARSIIYFS